MSAIDTFGRAARTRTCIRRTGFCSRRCSGSRGFTRRPICSWSPGRCAAWRRPSSTGGSPTICSSSGSGWSGLGTAFYFLPKLAGRPLQSHYLALFAFWTLILFGTWCGIPPGAPVPAWMPTLSAVAAVLLIVPLLAVAIVGWRTVWGSVMSKWDNGPFCFIGSGMDCFCLSGLMLIAMACPQISRVTEFTWFGPAETQLHLYGFFAMTMFGAIYYLLPRVVGFELPFPKLARVHFWLSLLGVVLAGRAAGHRRGGAGVETGKIPTSPLPTRPRPCCRSCASARPACCSCCWATCCSL